MEFFKERSPEERPGIKKDHGLLDRAIKDQEAIGITGELSIGDYAKEVNDKIRLREIIDQDGPTMKNSSETEAHKAISLDALKLLYVEQDLLNKGVEEIDESIENIKKQLENTHFRARRLALKEMLDDDKEKNVAEQAYTAEISEDNLKRKLKVFSNELRALKEKLQDIHDQIKAHENLYDGGKQHYKDFLN